MSSSAPRLVSIMEYQLATHGAPVIAMTNGVAASIQRAGLATREQVAAALATAVDLAGPGATDSDRLLVTVLSLAGSWRELWLEYSDRLGGWTATWLDGH